MLPTNSTQSKEIAQPLNPLLLPDVVALTEIWFNASFSDSEVDMEGCKHFRTNRHGNRLGGGVVIFLKDFEHLHYISINLSQHRYSFNNN